MSTPLLAPSRTGERRLRNVDRERVVITRHGKPAAVVISAADLESLEETLQVVSRPRLITQVRDSLAELAAREAEVLSREDILARLRA